MAKGEGKMEKVGRREFVKNAALGAAGLLILRNAKSAYSYQANEKLNIACVGVGGHGWSNLMAVSSENIVALCDVDEQHASQAFNRYPDVPKFADFREMLDKMHNQIDAVVVTTPDHTHAVISVAAMKLGKHVYCEKPLTRTVYEARVMRETAAKQKVVTQMGNQGSATEGLRRAVELAWAGVIGEIREAHVWFGGGNHPVDRPSEEPQPPPGFNWDLWLGPAPYRPFHPAYIRGAWRNWRPFGTGVLGDFGCHTANLAFRALRLDMLWDPKVKRPKGAVIRVSAEASEIHPETYSRWVIVRYEFPARGNLPPVKLTWYNGGPRPPEEILRDLGQPMTDAGCLLLGTKGAIFSDCPWNTRFTLLPRKQFEGFQGPSPILPRSPGHHAEWILACKGKGPKPFSSFDIGGTLTEVILLGNVALLVGHPIEYDPLTGRIVNCAEANRFLHREYRAGWRL
jgi:hypothetical protein